MSFVTMRNQKDAEVNRLFEDYSDEEIREMYQENATFFHTIEKSEKIARKLIQDKGGFFYYVHDDFKRIFSQLVRYIKLHNITVDNCAKYVDVTSEDVVERLRENEAKEVSMLFDQFLEFSDSHNNSSMLNQMQSMVSTHIAEKNAFYDSLIAEYLEKYDSKRK